MPDLSFPPNYIEYAVNDPVTKYSRRVDVYESNNTTLWATDVPIISGSVSVDQTRDERRSADLTLLSINGSLKPNRNGGFWYDKIIKVVMGVETSSGNWEANIFTGVIDRIGTEDSRGQTKVTCRDFAKRMKYGLPYATAWPENTPIENVITALAQGSGLPTTPNLPLTGVNTGEEFFFDQGSDRWGAAYEVATAYGYDLWFDADGDLQLTEFEDPTTTQPQFSFQTGATSNLVSIGRQVNDSLIRNHIVVHGTAPDESPVWGEAMNTVADSPTNVSKLGLRTEVYSSNWVTNFAQAQEVAENRLAYKSLEAWEASVGTIIVPWLEAGIIVNFEDPEAIPGDPDRYLLSSFSIPLELSAASAELRRVTNVIDYNPEYPSSSVYPANDIYPNEAQV